MGGEDNASMSSTLSDRGVDGLAAVAAHSQQPEPASITHIVMPEVAAPSQQPGLASITHIVMPEVFDYESERGRDKVAGDDGALAVPQEPLLPALEAKALCTSVIGGGASTLRQSRPIRRSKYFM